MVAYLPIPSGVLYEVRPYTVTVSCPRSKCISYQKTLSWQVTKSSPVNVTAEIERVQDKRDYVIATLNWKHVEFLLNCLPLHLHLQKIW